jgi:hypothetical protein
MGKPPRERMQSSETQAGASRTAGERPNSSEKRKCDDNDYRRRTAGSRSDTISSTSASSPSINDLHSTWGSVDEDFTNVLTNANMLDALANFSSMDSGDWAWTDDDLLSTHLESEPFSTFSWPEFDTSPSQGAAPQLPQLKEGSPFMPQDDSCQPDCKCVREAYDILGNLSFMNPNKTQSAITSAPSAAATPANQFPLDYILHVNRECSERLGRLLTCACAGCPHVASLHASIISRILNWYYREAGCSKSNLPNATGLPVDTAMRSAVLPTGSLDGALCGSPSSPWSSSTSASASISGSSSMSGMSGMSARNLNSTQMAMGCFHIDDERVQAALRIQLLLGEMKRVGCLVDIFASRSSRATDESASGSVDTLYKSLGSWLAREHSSIVEMMRFRLREVSI